MLQVSFGVLGRRCSAVTNPALAVAMIQVPSRPARASNQRALGLQQGVFRRRVLADRDLYGCIWRCRSP